MGQSVELDPVRFVLAIALVAACPLTVAAQDAPPYVVVVDRDMTPEAGTIDLLAIQRALAAAEDRVLPPTRFSETTLLKRTLGIGYRLGKFLALDLPQDDFLMVVAHEVYGHGARLREIDAAPIHYHFDPPLPYGGGGAVTEFNGDAVVTRADFLGIDTAGIEAQNELAQGIARQAVVRGALHHREAWLYLESRLDGLRYIRSVSPRSSEGHDVAAFLRDFNDECNPPACSPLDGPTLKRRALVMLGDPLLAYAAYGMAVSYLVRGRPSVGVPMIPLSRGVRYLPALRFEMTPYGTEWTMEHNLLTSGRLASLSLRFGDTGQRRAWGIGLIATNVVRRDRFTAQLSADVWRQPPLDSSPASRSLATGGLASATAYVALGRISRAPVRFGLHLQGGYKSDGFVRGQRLRAGPVVRAGLTFSP